MRTLRMCCWGAVFTAGVLAWAMLTAGPAGAVNLPQIKAAGLNSWITPPTSGVPVRGGDFPKGSLLENLVSGFSQKGPCQIAGIYRLPAEPGLYTAQIKAPPQTMYLVNGLWVFGNPLHAKASGDNGVSWLRSHGYYTPRPFKCNEAGQRINFRVSTESKGKYIYLVVLTKKPGTPVSLMLQFPGTPDAVVGATGSTPPWCPEAKGYTWGNVYSRSPYVIRADGPAADEGPAAAGPADCPNGCTAQAITGGMATGTPVRGRVIDGRCEPGYFVVQGGQGVSCLKCQAGYRLVRTGMLGKEERVACLRCPDGQALQEVRREHGVHPSGQEWNQSTFSCLGCAPGYQLEWPLSKKGQRTDGVKWSWRNAGCWRCPPDSRIKTQTRQVLLPDGSQQEQKSFSCVK